MEDIRTATVALKALVELGYPLELSSLIDYLAKPPDSRDELVKFDNEDTLSIFLKKFPSMFWVDGCKVFPAQLKPKAVSRCSKQTPLPQSHSAVQPATHEREVDRKQENVDTETLQKQAALHFMEVLRAKGPLPLTRIHGYIDSCPVQVRQAIPTGPVKIRELFLKYSSNFTIDANDVVHLQPSPITEVSNDNVSITPLVTTSSSREENCDKAEASTSTSDGIGLNGSTETSTSSSKEDSDVKSTQDMETLVKDGAAHVDTLENKGSMPPGGVHGSTETSTSSSKEDSDVKRTQDMEALLEEGAGYIVDILENKGSMPLCRIHGHVNQCREEVRKAIGGGPEKARALFLKFPAYFYIDDHDDVHLTSKLTQECIKAVLASLEKNGPLQLGELVSRIGLKLGLFLKRNDPKTFMQHHSERVVLDDNMVYLVSAIEKEGIEHFKKVLESKGSLHIKNLSGHSSQYKYLGPMLKIIGGGPSSVMDFLKGSPEVFSIGDDGMVHLTSATISQSQGKKSGTDNRSYAMVVETGQKIHLEDKKAKKEGILLEGVQHFKQALESKGSMPLKNIFGHVNQCRNEVKWAVGCSMDNVETFLLKYPGVFHIDKNLMVHLVCNRAQGQQQKQHKTNIKQLPIEEKALAHFKGMLSRKGPSTIHVLSSCFSSCGQDIRRHVGSSKEGLTKFFRKHPQIFKVDANEVVSLHASSTVFKPQRWASCDTLAVPRDTAFPRVLSKLSGGTPDVRSAVDGGTLQQAEEVQDKPNQLTEKGCKDMNEIGDGASTCTSMPCPQTQHTPDQKADSSNNIPDKFFSAVKNILSERGCLHIAQLVKELDIMLPFERFELSGVRLFLKKCPDDFHVNDQDIVEELPPMNVFAVVHKILGNGCFATLEDTSSVYVYIGLYRERMGVYCTRLQDHLSTGDILLVDTLHDKAGRSVKWAATNIRAVFKSSKSVNADKNGLNLQTPMPFLPATTIARSPSEIRAVIVKLVASFLRVTSPLQLKDLCSRMKYLNHDAVLYLREKGGLLSFLQSLPQLFQVQDECVTLVAGEGEFEEGTSQCLATPRARCTIGEVSVISKNIAHLCLPDDKKAILDLTDAHNSITTSRLSVGDCIVAYIVPSNQSGIPWEVSEVKCVMGKAVPAQIRAKTATATCGSDRLKEAPQQSVLEGEQQQMEDQTDQENNQQEPGQKLDRAEIEKETLDLIVNLVQKSGQVSLRSLQGHINLLGEEKQDCIKGKGGLLTFLQHHFGTIFKIDSTSENISLRGGQDAHETEADVLTDSSAKGEQLQPSQLTVEEEVEMVRSSPEKTSICVDISDAEDSKKNHNVPMKETGDDIATSVLKTRHNTEDCDDVDISTVVTPSVFVAQETDIVHTPNALLEQYLNEKETVCDSFGLPTATVHPVVPVDNPPGQPDDDFTSLLHMFKDNLSPIQDNLVEVEMDIGRIPIARYYNPASPNLLAPLRLSEEMLTRETLETILSALPLDRSPTGQGRVLLRGSLHWVSTLKNSLDEVVGLTLRRGQAVPGCLDLLWDMVTSGTSTLIIGRPCSGKTTLLREWARVLSDVCYRRVIVVDTLNEIAGGDDVPHPGVGGARRVQVHNRCQQVSQLQTAARNHSPDCIIVDEVQTLEEVTALQAIRLTGIQLIAGVCAGSLPDLLHNSVMRGLLGMSDPPSSTSASRGVIPQPPTFPHILPVFQAAVQIHNRDNLSVYSDVASFVRMSLLEGRFPLAQQRKRVVTNGRQTEL